MAVNTETLGSGGPAIPARPIAVSPARTLRRIGIDRWTSRLVIVGGLVVIASILGILLVILAETWPLFRPPTARLLATVATGQGATPWSTPGSEGFDVDEYREVAFALTRDGAVRFQSLKEGVPIPPVPIPGLVGARMTATATSGKGRYVVGTSDGRVLPVEVGFDVAFAEGIRTVTPKVTFGDAMTVDPDQRRPVLRVAVVTTDAGPLTVAQVGPTELVLQTVQERKALVGPSRREETRQTLTPAVEGEITALRLDGRGEDLFLGTSRGQLLRYDLRATSGPVLAETVDATADRSAIRVLGLLIGDRTLVTGDEVGGVSSWQVVQAPTGGRRLTRIHRFAPHGAPVLGFAASRRDKGFVTGDSRGRLHVAFGTSGQTLLTLETPGGDPLRAVAFAPKADGLVTLDDAGRLRSWQLDNRHPEITLTTLFGKVWYEGYPGPAYVWQSTGGTDDFESKYSLSPLIYGTLKGTFYALLLAVPLSLLAAVYVSEFMHPTIKSYVKPVVEIMAALPSVVLGFLAGLWLAPVIERIVPGIFLAPAVLVVAILAALLVWQLVPGSLRGRLRGGTEILLLVPVVVAGLWTAFALGGVVEATLLGGSYREWLQSVLGLTYDQRNSLVVGIAMGFAVIPIIFTIAEDSLANVPGHLRAGSLALGATRWQTAVRIVLPTASPGIFSAVMIGFGRAVGETMIVLMATGNTPVMDWSIFNGFRALSANIAVELPEAPEGATLFRVLFLAALLLFCLTFAVNTAAEMVRLRLRQKFRYL
jgi:phosphate transport system permease protein